jgi:hypothetical protein
MIKPYRVHARDAQVFVKVGAGVVALRGGPGAHAEVFALAAGVAVGCEVGDDVVRISRGRGCEGEEEVAQEQENGCGIHSGDLRYGCHWKGSTKGVNRQDELLEDARKKLGLELGFL